jgi:hypothetical protein
MHHEAVEGLLLELSTQVAAVVLMAVLRRQRLAATAALA